MAILAGVFASASMKSHVLDLSSGTGKAANISASAFIDGLQLMGDAQDRLTAVAMQFRYPKPT